MQGLNIRTQVLIYTLLIGSTGIFVSCSAPEPEKDDDNLVICSYDGGQLILGELLFYLQLSNSPLSRLVDLNKAYFQAEQPAAKQDVLDAIKNLAFYRLLRRVPEYKEFIKDPVNDLKVHFAAKPVVVNLWKNYRKMTQIDVTEYELQKEYEQNRAQFYKPAEVSVSLVFVPYMKDKSEPNPALERLKSISKNEDFAEKFENYVKEFTEAYPGTRSEFLDFFSSGTHSIWLEEQAFKLNRGELSPIFEMEKGYILLKCLERRPETIIPLEKVHKQLVKTITNRKFKEMVKEEIKRLKEQFEYEIFEGDTLPDDLNFDLVRIGDFAINAGDFFSLYPGNLNQLRAQPELIPKFTQSLLQEELIYQDVVRNLAPEIEGFRSDLETVESYFGALQFIDYKAKHTIEIPEDEMKSFYESRKEFYHTQSPRELRYIRFFVSDDASSAPVTSPQLKEVEDKARTFAEKAREQQDFVRTFEQMNDASMEMIELGFVDQFPEDWNMRRGIRDFPLHYISDPVRLDDEFIIFHIGDEGEYRILSFDEVRQKVYNVLFGEYMKRFVEDMRERVLTKYHFELKV